MRMVKKSGSALIITLTVVVSLLVGCSNKVNVEDEVKGWAAGSDVENEAESDAKTDSVEKITCNTDTPGEGLSVEVEELIGKSILIKITNANNVCYDSVNFTVRFFQQSGVYHEENGYAQMYCVSGEVPAYSEVYELVAMPSYETLASGGKESSNADIIHYETLKLSTIQSVVIDGYRVSEEQLQDASEYLIVTETGINETGQIALIGNKTNASIRFEAFVIYDEGEAGYLECSDHLPGKNIRIRDNSTENPKYIYCEDTEDYRVAGYAGKLKAPAALEGITVGEKYNRSEELYAPDLESCSIYRIIIARAYFEFDEFQ